MGSTANNPLVTYKLDIIMKSRLRDDDFFNRLMEAIETLGPVVDPQVYPIG